MTRQDAKEEYTRALRLGQREQKELLAAGKDTNPKVLDQILCVDALEKYQHVGLVEIPIDRIVGTKSAGRIAAFSASFLPLLPLESEFAIKWMELCLCQTGEEGIREPIECYEYLGEFYVQEGNKRVSVLKYLGATRINAVVQRILPAASDEPRIKAYFEFLEFFKDTGLYSIQFRRPGEYERLVNQTGKQLGQTWTERERRALKANLHYFTEAFYALDGRKTGVLPEDAMLLWLQVHSYADLGRMTAAELKKSLAAMWQDLQAVTDEEGVRIKTVPDTQPKGGIVSWLMNMASDHVKVAFVHQRTPESSPWTKAHDEGRQHLEQVLGDYVKARSYFEADTPETAEAILEQAVADGAQVIFTTTPQLCRVTLKVALKYPRIRFLNCSVNRPFSSVRSYYSRIYEGKFITGAIAGAMAANDRIGYIGSSPIYGVPASINAFALGALLTNPRATIELRWSCMAGNPVQELIDSGIKVISNRDMPTADQQYLDLCNYGTYRVDDRGELVSLGSPYWDWGRFYENVISSILAGTWDDAKGKAVNYWWGMDSGVIDVKLAKKLPPGVYSMAQMLRKGVQHGLIDPFARPITAQDGTLKNDGSRSLSAEELLRMDWLCDSVHGCIPSEDQIEPYARSIVQELGIFRDWGGAL